MTNPPPSTCELLKVSSMDASESQNESIPDIVLAIEAAPKPPPPLNEVETRPVASNSPRKKVEKIDVLRKPVSLPANPAEITRKLVRRSLPKALAVELYNPETDDADTSESSSSSPNSVSSVVSVVNEETVAAQRRESESEEVGEKRLQSSSEATIQDRSTACEEGNTENVKEVRSLESSKETGSSSDSLASHSSPSKRKLTLARLGSTSEWLSSIPTEASGSGTKRHPGEKILLGEVKKLQQKGPETKWPSSLIDESPPPSALQVNAKDEEDKGSSALPTASSLEMAERLLEELEEQDSLFDSIENLTSRQGTSRNPSLDSSIRMSSTCSCSLRGGDSFESYSSAKSSLTNSSSTHLRNSGSFAPLQSTQLSKYGGSPVSRRKRHPDYSKSCSAAEETEESTSGQTYHRYYHVFREGELDKLIEKYVQNLHIISSYYDHANWCVVAEKVQVWTI